MDSNPYQPPSASSSTPVARPWPLSILFAMIAGLPLAIDVAVLLSTGTTGRFIWLLQQAAPIVIVAWPISVPIAIWIWYAFKAASDTGELDSPRLVWLAPLIVIPITVLVWGAVFAHSRGQGFAQWQLAVVHWAFFASAAIGMLAIAFNRGRRSLVAASTMMLMLISFSCCFIAGSSVTGDWL